MAQDHFQTTPDPQNGHGRTKNPKRIQNRRVLWIRGPPIPKSLIWTKSWSPYGSIFLEKSACGNVPTSRGLAEIWVTFFWEKKAPAATYPQVGGLKKYGGHFSEEKKTPAATYPQVKGFQKFGPLGIQAEKQGFRTAWLITGQKFPWKNLKSGSSLLTFRDLSSHICEIILWMAKSGILDPGKTGFFQTPLFAGFWKNRTGHFSKIWNFQNVMFQPFKKCSY